MNKQNFKIIYKHWTSIFLYHTFYSVELSFKTDILFKTLFWNTSLFYRETTIILDIVLSFTYYRLSLFLN